jgi:cyclase
MREALPELETIVPGHGPMGDGHAAVDALVRYLEVLHDEVAASVAAGRTLEETYAACADPWADDLDPSLAAAMAGYRLPREQVRQAMLRLCRDMHRLNILATYRIYEKA